MSVSTKANSLMPTLRALLRVAPRLLKGYVVFAVLNLLYKIIKLQRIRSVQRAAVAGLPGYDTDTSGKAMRANLHRLNDWRTDVINAFPDADFVRMPAPGIGITAKSARAVQWLLSDAFANNTKADIHQSPLSYLLGEFIGHDGIFCLKHGNQTPELSRDHAKWFHQRKQASKIFTRRAFNDLMHSVFKTKALEFASILDTHSRSDKADEAVDMQELYSAFTLDSTLTIFFGMESGMMGGKGGAGSNIGKAFDRAQRSMMQLIFSSIPAFMSGLAPWPFASLSRVDSLGSVGLAVSFYRNPHHRTFRDAVAELDAEIYPIIRELRSTPMDEDEEQDEKKEGGISESKRRNNNLTKMFMQDPSFKDQELRDLILNMIIAGRDTTSNALSWLTALLTQNPEQQRKLCDEIDTAVWRIHKQQAEEDASTSNANSPVVPTLEDVSPENMPYLNGCVYEALRLFPPVPFDQKIVVEDCAVPFGLGGRIAAGTRVNFCPYAMGRDPDNWPEPLAFKPERWIPFTTPSAYAFPVFQGGPRSCLGQNMALFEMKLLMTVLMQKRSFELKEGEAEHLKPSLMLTIAVCNSKQKMGTGEDTFNLWVHPRDR